ncbi:MAG: ammonium transporter, partial [Terriglobales bacterium]
MPNQISSGDTAWMLMSAALVFVMVPGLSFFYTGLVRKKNALNTLMMTLVAMAIGTVVWLVVGYSLAFASGTPWLGGFQWCGFNGVGQATVDYAPTIPHFAFAAFQGMFAAITPALISGAIVERMNFRAYVTFLTLWSAVIYAPVAHWVWGADGWIHKLGALDFAGGTVVHVSAGCAALVCALMLGPRTDHKRAALVPHNVPFVLLGAGLLWFGWFGFNGGSALAANGTAGLAFVTTNLSACGAMLTWLVLESFRSGKPTAVGAATGSVVGLVGITPAAGYVTPIAGLAIGMITAAVSFAALQLRSRSELDDTLDVFACHGIGGISGAILTGCFATLAMNSSGADGLFAGNPSLLLAQLTAISATILYASIGSAALLKV